MINKLEKDDNIVKDEDCTKTKAYSVLWKLRDEIHHKRATKRDLKTLIESLQSALSALEDVE